MMRLCSVAMSYIRYSTDITAPANRLQFSPKKHKNMVDATDNSSISEQVRLQATKKYCQSRTLRYCILLFSKTFTRALKWSTTKISILFVFRKTKTLLYTGILIKCLYFFNKMYVKNEEIKLFWYLHGEKP